MRAVTAEHSHGALPTSTGAWVSLSSFYGHGVPGAAIFGNIHVWMVEEGVCASSLSELRPGPRGMHLGWRPSVLLNTVSFHSACCQEARYRASPAFCTRRRNPHKKMCLWGARRSILSWITLIFLCVFFFLIPRVHTPPWALWDHASLMQHTLHVASETQPRRCLQNQHRSYCWHCVRFTGTNMAGKHTGGISTGVLNKDSGSALKWPAWVTWKCYIWEAHRCWDPGSRASCGPALAGWSRLRENHSPWLLYWSAYIHRAAWGRKFSLWFPHISSTHFLARNEKAPQWATLFS